MPPLENVFHWFPSNGCHHINVGAPKIVDCLEILSKSRDGTCSMVKEYAGQYAMKDLENKK